MAINRLTDIITVFDSKWTYGDVKFGYEPDVNQDHDTKYPLMLVEPPISTIKYSSLSNMLDFFIPSIAATISGVIQIFSKGIAFDK